MYRILSSDSDHFEICDECGFHGGLVDISEAAARLTELGAA